MIFLSTWNSPGSQWVQCWLCHRLSYLRRCRRRMMIAGTTPLHLSLPPPLQRHMHGLLDCWCCCWAHVLAFPFPFPFAFSTIVNCGERTAAAAAAAARRLGTFAYVRVWREYVTFVCTTTSSLWCHQSRPQLHQQQQQPGQAYAHIQRLAFVCSDGCIQFA